MVRRFEINIRKSDYAAFRSWQSATGDSFPANEHAQETPHTPSPTRTTRDFADREDGTTRSVRVQGGAESLELETENAGLLGGEFYYTARIAVEGFE